jgi:molybdate transport system substrate-binding protein
MRFATFLLTLLMLVSPLRAAGVPTVAAASDLRFAMDELVAAYSRDTGRQVKVSYGSSGIFRQQIANGAPFEIFLSADEAYVRQLQQADLTRDGGALYAIGRIVLFAPKGSLLAVDGQMDGLRRALAEGKLRRFAIANPDHAPYGARAREALRHAGLWTGLEKRLVLGENVSQALQFAATGGADGGIIALSLVKAPGFAKQGNWALIPAEWHQPLRQRMVLTKKAGPEARDFYRWLQGREARAILVRHGFALPGETG